MKGKTSGEKSTPQLHKLIILKWLEGLKDLNEIKASRPDLHPNTSGKAI